MSLTVWGYVSISIFAGVLIALRLRSIANAAKRQVAAPDWPDAEATIQSGSVENVGTPRTPEIRPCFSYTYVVNGEYYSGGFSLAGCDDDSAANLSREMINKKLTVRYNPSKPANHQISIKTMEGFEVSYAWA